MNKGSESLKDMELMAILIGSGSRKHPVEKLANSYTFSGHIYNSSVSSICFRQDFLLFLIWIQTPVYFLHQFEEYILPGGFVPFFNKKMLGSDKDEYPLDKQASFWINVPIIFIAFPLSAILAGRYGLSMGIWTVYFSIINSASHVGMFFKNRYNPGFWISLLVNIPVGVFTIIYLISNQLLPFSAHIAGGLIGLTIQGAVMLYGFKVLKPRV